MSLSQQLQALRVGRGLSQEALAAQLNVSRQTVGKWETGAALPELPSLMALCRLYRVSLDRLVREDSSCAEEAASASLVPDDALTAFLLRAKRATYAGHGPETAPSRPASHDFAYEEAPYRYLDTYLGGQRFAGEEAVWLADQPLWSMNYAGRTLSDRFSGDFLKDALSHATADMPYRGPAVYRAGDWVYHCMADGDFDWFHGREEILCGGQRVYECRFHGGSLRYTEL